MAKQNNRDIVFDHFPSAPEFKAGINHLVAIGIDDYKHVAKLSNAVRDAQAFVQLMQEKYDFDAENVYTLYDAKANKKEITKTLRELIDKVDKVKDNVIIYFSGHGHYDQVLKEGYWVPVNAKYQAEVDYISYSYIKKVVKAIPSQHTVMIVDSCYSGSVLMGSRDLMAERVEKDPSRWMVASGRNEVVPDGIIGENSPFAENLLGILNRYADQGLRLGTLVEKLTTAVSYNSKQTPIGRPMYEVGDQGGEFVFHPKPTPEKLWARAQQENTVAAYTAFLSRHKNSKFTKDAQARLTQLQQAEQTVITQGITQQPSVITESVPPVADAQVSSRSFASGAANPTTPKTTDENLVNALLKNRVLIYGLVALMAILAGLFGYSSHKNNKAEHYTLMAKVSLSEGKFDDAKEHSDAALSYVAGHDSAVQLNNKAEMGINAEGLYQRGQDSLKFNHFDGAIGLFGAAEKLYDAIPYHEGSNNMQNAIGTAKTAKNKYQEEKAMAEAQSKAEERLIHATFQKMYKDSAAIYFLQGNYNLAVKTYMQLDDTTNVADDLAKARIGNAGKLPAMAKVTGHTTGDFYIGKHEVTNEQYCAFLNAIGKHADDLHPFINLNQTYTAIVLNDNKYAIREGNEQRPVTGVSWYGAQAYSKWAGGTLPSPEQWKYAAREGLSNSKYEFSGSNKAYDVAVFYTDGNTRTYPAKVGTKAPNSIGLYDMSGNAWEWTSNGRETSRKQFIMGGSINRGISYAKINSNYQNSPSAFGSENNNNDLGFRMLRMAPKPTTSEDAVN